MGEAEKSFYEEAGRQYDSVTAGGIFQYFVRRRKEALRALGLDREGLRVLDVGGGTGVYRDVFSRSSGVVGLDYSFSSLSAYGKKYPRSLLVNADALSLPFRMSSVDVVILFGLIHHIYKRITELFSEVVRVLKPGGLLVVDEPNGYNLLWHVFLMTETGQRIDGGLTRPVLPASMRKLMRERRFEILSEKYWGFLPHKAGAGFIPAFEEWLERSPLRFIAIRYSVVARKPVESARGLV